MDVNNKVVNLIYLFQTAREVNIASHLYKKSSKSLLWKWLYYVIPIAGFSGNILMLICNHVLYTPKNKFTYFNDLSNSMCLTLLYFVSYFLSGYYPLKLDEFLKNGIDKDWNKEISECLKTRKKPVFLLFVIGFLMFFIGVGAGYVFYSTAKSNSNAYWIYHLDVLGRAYYCLFLGVTWYHSLSLLVMALAGGFVVYWAIKSEKLNYIDEDFNQNRSIISAVNIVFSTFSYGLFYIIGAFLFIINDRVAKKYGVYNMFCEDIPSLVLVLVITLLVILAYLPLQELFVFMKVKKDCLISSLNERISKESSFDRRERLTAKRNDLIKQNLIYTSLANKIIFILSVLVPLAGLVLQGMDLAMKK